MSFLSEYLEYVVDFKARQFYMTDENNNHTVVIPFDTDVGFEMLIGFALQLVNYER